jgi:hypothetical protein
MTDPCIQDFTAPNADLSKLDKPSRPCWHPIRAGSDENLPECGKILCSFALAPINAQFKQKAEDFKLTPLIQTKEFTVDIHALGMR